MCLLFISSPGFYVTLCIVKRFLCQKSRRSSNLPLLLSLLTPNQDDNDDEFK